MHQHRGGRRWSIWRSLSFRVCRTKSFKYFTHCLVVLLTFIGKRILYDNLRYVYSDFFFVVLCHFFTFVMFWVFVNQVMCGYLTQVYWLQIDYLTTAGAAQVSYIHDRVVWLSCVLVHEKLIGVRMHLSVCVQAQKYLVFLKQWMSFECDGFKAWAVILPMAHSSLCPVALCGIFYNNFICGALVWKQVWKSHTWWAWLFYE